jgi:hypothetical protein
VGIRKKGELILVLRTSAKVNWPQLTPPPNPHTITRYLRPETPTSEARINASIVLGGPWNCSHLYGIHRKAPIRPPAHFPFKRTLYFLRDVNVTHLGNFAYLYLIQYLLVSPCTRITLSKQVGCLGGALV